VVVINPDGQRAVLPNGVEVLAPIEIKSVEPQSGGLAGGTKITIVGETTVEFQGRRYPSRFVKGAEVFVGGEEVTYPSVTVQSDHVLTVLTPPNTPGPRDVEVVNPDGSGDTLDNAFTYNPLPQVIRVVPDNGRLAGGTKILIQGGGFLPGARVFFIDPEERTFAQAAEVHVESDTRITAITPEVPGEPGPKDVVVRNPDRQEATLPEGFTYNPPPVITRIEPPFGPASGGVTLTLEGRNFMLGARVFIGKRPAVTEVKHEGLIEAITPRLPEGFLPVAVVNPDTQEAVVKRGFQALGELVYNYPNPFLAADGTTFRYATKESVLELTIRIFNLDGSPVGTASGFNTREVRWVEPGLQIGLYAWVMEVKLENGQVRRFQRQLEVY
jgi:hypothetical protein